jgi:uncharacterized pyridoxamine 5'-phosphate oxidase family protein
MKEEKPLIEKWKGMFFRDDQIEVLEEDLKKLFDDIKNDPKLQLELITSKHIFITDFIRSKILGDKR